VNRLKPWRGRERFPNSELEWKSATPRSLVYETARLAPIGRRVAIKYYPKSEQLYLDEDDPCYEPSKGAILGKWKDLWPWRTYQKTKERYT